MQVQQEYLFDQNNSVLEFRHLPMILSARDHVYLLWFAIRQRALREFVALQW